MNTNPRLPFEKTYWVAPGKLLAGCYPGDRDPAHRDKKLTALIDCGISHVVNIMEPGETDHDGELFASYREPMQSIAKKLGIDITFSGHSIPDMGTTSNKNMKTILDDIDSSILKNRPVYLHCWGGLGRTGTVAGCWIVRHGMASGSDALMVISRLREQASNSHCPSPQTDEQRDMVINWHTE